MGGMGDEGAGERGFAALGGGEVLAQSRLGSRNEKHSARFWLAKCALKQRLRVFPLDFIRNLLSFLVGPPPEMSRNGKILVASPPMKFNPLIQEIKKT